MNYKQNHPFRENCSGKKTPFKNRVNEKRFVLAYTYREKGDKSREQWIEMIQRWPFVLVELQLLDNGSIMGQYNYSYFLKT
jgi:hypothetical protein